MSTHAITVLQDCNETPTFVSMVQELNAILRILHDSKHEILLYRLPDNEKIGIPSTMPKVWDTWTVLICYCPMQSEVGNSRRRPQSEHTYNYIGCHTRPSSCTCNFDFRLHTAVFAIVPLRLCPPPPRTHRWCSPMCGWLEELGKEFLKCPSRSKVIAE